MALHLVFPCLWGPWTDPSQVIAVPRGLFCARCDEPFTEGDVGVIMPVMAEDPYSIGYHRECHLRGIVGSVAHQKRECVCYGGEGEDDPNLTAREAARAAVTLFQQRAIYHRSVEEFTIGTRFCMGGTPEVVWRCTDVGSRTVIAIEEREDWESGPPFAVEEIVFDEYDLRDVTIL